MSAGVSEKFERLNTWGRGDKRAPHKPLLVLYAFGQWQAGNRQVEFEDVERDVGTLLRDFGPPRKTTAVYPFCRLENDGVWIIDAPDDIVRRSGNKDPLITELRCLKTQAGFTPKILAALDADPTLAGRIAHQLLDAHFPDSVHADILSAVGPDTGTYTTKRCKRDATIRPRILAAYECRCCVCGFGARIGTVPIALDSAHIRWHQAGGPDEEQNGLALCPLHDRTLDLGTFTIDEGLTMHVSDKVVGAEQAEAALHAFHRTDIRHPQRPEYRPSVEALEWYRREVFTGQPRHAG